MTDSRISRSVFRLLAESFERHGYVRQQDERRRRREGCAQYKKGDEIRIVVETKRELASLRKALERASFSPGKPFEKGRRWCQPIYGRVAVGRFLRVVGAGRRETR